MTTPDEFRPRILVTKIGLDVPSLRYQVWLQLSAPIRNRRRSERLTELSLIHI